MYKYCSPTELLVLVGWSPEASSIMGALYSVLLLFRHSLVTVEILTELGKAIVDVTQWEYELRSLVLLFVWLLLPLPPLKCIGRIGANWVKHNFISFLTRWCGLGEMQ